MPEKQNSEHIMTASQQQQQLPPMATLYVESSAGNENLTADDENSLGADSESGEFLQLNDTTAHSQRRNDIFARRRMSTRSVGTSSSISYDEEDFVSLPDLGNDAISLDALSIDVSDHGNGDALDGSAYSSSQEGATARAVSLVRVMVITVLLTAAAIASNLVYLVVLHAEERHVAHHFLNSQAEDVRASIRDEFRARAYWHGDGMGRAEATRARDRRWPFVRAELDPGAGQAWFSPLVSGYDREKWEEYAGAILREEEGSSQQAMINEPVFPTFADDSRNQLLASPRSMVEYRSTSAYDRATEGMFRIRNGRPEPLPTGELIHFPVWNSVGDRRNDTILFDQMSDDARRYALTTMISAGTAVWTDLYYGPGGNDSIHSSYSTPTSGLYVPIYRGGGGTEPLSLLLGAMLVEVDWISLLEPPFLGLERVANSMIAVVETVATSEETNALFDDDNQGRIRPPCGQMYSFDVTNHGVEFLGPGDHHDDSVDGPRVSTILELSGDDQDNAKSSFFSVTQVCEYRLSLYPTHETFDAYRTDVPNYYQAAIAIVFLSCTVFFILYDCIAENRQREIVRSAKRSKAIVHSLFPSNVRGRLYAEKSKKSRKAANRAAISAMQTPKLRLKSFLSNDNNENNEHGQMDGNRSRKMRKRNQDYADNGEDDIISGEPIADLFPHATVLFADISGFTAWSSEREPVQVFSLLESFYGAMDQAARTLGVFKVETVGDCYVAATGLPDPREDHAVLMVRFANTCLFRIQELAQVLESSLGPGTADLAMRFGIHSGPVTAGVLRGEKSRFQLFGDTMNTAARMESTGIPNKIHLSKETTALLKAAGKEHWLIQREGMISAKGKGELQTYWLRLPSEKHAMRSMQSSGDLGGLNASLHMGTPRSTRKQLGAEVGKQEKDEQERLDMAVQERQERLINWNVEELMSILKRVVARRKMQANAYPENLDLIKQPSSLSVSGYAPLACSSSSSSSGLLIDEVREVVTLPAFDPRVPGQNTTELDDEVRKELHDFVSQIAEGYLTENSFHNFEHASHVCLSAGKLLRRIVHSDAIDYKGPAVAHSLHNATYGISSDPLTHFAVVLSALIHDVGHTGVPNGRLAVEHPEIASKYRNQSIAEQRSVDLAWELLSAPCYTNLRNSIFTTACERTQFRQLVVNSVLATDIFDKELGALRKARWQRAFYGGGDQHTSILQTIVPEESEEDRNRKATIVIEHIIQASDVAHTMQHWHIYNRWNQKLFSEMYAAYKTGRSDKDPSDGWYKGELWFFDNYVIPLAKKLKDCGVFGVSSDEYLNYAKTNREEWARKGEQVVEGYIESCAEK